MPLQKPLSGTAAHKRNSWMRGNGSYSMRGEKKRDISRNKKYLNRKVRRKNKIALHYADYKRICRTLKMIDFT